LTLLVAGAGCGFHAVAGDGGGAHDLGVGGNADDLGGAGAGGAGNHGGAGGVGGAGGTGGAGGSGGAGGTGGAGGAGSCAPPWLLVSVENLHNGDVGGGRVARWSLASGAASSCGALSGQGGIGAQPLAVAAAGGGVAAVTTDKLYYVDPTDDHVSWSQPIGGGLPNRMAYEAFAMSDASGHPLLVAATALADNPPAVRQLDVFALDGKVAPMTPWCIQSTCGHDLGLSTLIEGMTADPVQPTKLLALDDFNDVPALSVDPVAVTKTKYATSIGIAFTRLYATRSGTNTLRLAWVDGNDAPNHVYYANDVGGNGTPTIHGPLRCADGSCDTIVHAVPDPSGDGGFFVLCEASGATPRRVVRLDTNGCSELVNGNAFGAQSRMSALGVGL
jgi:hypothetical protein